MKLYLNSLALHLKSELEYRMSFIISFLSQILINVIWLEKLF